MTAPNIPGSPPGSHAAPSTGQRLLLRCPEITLKGRNQGEFQSRLCGNIRRRLRAIGLAWPVRPAHGRVYVSVPESAAGAAPGALAALIELPGVDSIDLARFLRPNVTGQHRPELQWTPIEDEMVALAHQAFIPDARFAVRVNRVDKRLAVTSRQMEQRLGAVIRDRTAWDRVDLKHPDRTFHVDIYPDGMYLHSDKTRGIGGLPVGSSGRVLALLSGGIDSPVAAFLLAKRGCAVDLFHMSARQARREEIVASPVGRLAATLSRYTLRSRLVVAPYTLFDLAMSGRPTGFELVLFRRFLLRAAERLAGWLGAKALVTGDSLGQVASQTLENMTVSSQDLEAPVLRPLIGFNKQEIIGIARTIGSYEISIEPYKDCCALLARSPRTRVRHAQALALEHELLPEYETLVERTLDERLELRFECGSLRDGAAAASGNRDPQEEEDDGR